MNFTTRLGLSKPNSDPVTGDFVDVDVLNANADKLDAAIGFTPSTSGSPPSSPYTGQGRLDSDTGKSYVWGGSAWTQVMTSGAQYQHNSNMGIGTAPDANTLRKLRTYSSGTNGGLSQVLLEQSGPAAASRAFAVRAGGEANERWWVDFDGKMQWGPGTAGGDTNLYRSSASTLKTDDNLELGGGLTALGDLTTAANVTAIDITAIGTIDAKGVLHKTTYSGTTDANGFLTVTHGAPWTPTAGWFMTSNPASSFAQPWGVDSIGATTCRLRIANANGGVLASAAVVGFLFLVKG